MVKLCALTTARLDIAEVPLQLISYDDEMPDREDSEYTASKQVDHSTVESISVSAQEEVVESQDTQCRCRGCVGGFWACSRTIPFADSSREDGNRCDPSKECVPSEEVDDGMGLQGVAGMASGDHLARLDGQISFKGVECRSSNGNARGEEMDNSNIECAAGWEVNLRERFNAGVEGATLEVKMQESAKTDFATDSTVMKIAHVAIESNTKQLNHPILPEVETDAKENNPENKGIEANVIQLKDLHLKQNEIASANGTDKQAHCQCAEPCPATYQPLQAKIAAHEILTDEEDDDDSDLMIAMLKSRIRESKAKLEALRKL